MYFQLWENLQINLSLEVVCKSRRVLILWASCWLKLVSKRLFFQAHILWSMWSQLLWDESCHIRGLSRHKSYHFWAKVETRHKLSYHYLSSIAIKPSFTATHEVWILPYITLGLCPNCASKKSTDEKYLALRTSKIVVS